MLLARRGQAALLAVATLLAVAVAAAATVPK